MRTVSRAVYVADLVLKCEQAKSIARLGLAGTRSQEYAGLHRDMNRLLVRLETVDDEPVFGRRVG
jgi:hypothetical protein